MTANEGTSYCIFILTDMLLTSLDDPELNTHVPDASPVVTFEEVAGGTKRGGRKLLSSDGYCYTVKRSKDNYTLWYCIVRNRHARCTATVTQTGKTFLLGRHGHNHAADSGAAYRVKVSAKIPQIWQKQQTCTIGVSDLHIQTQMKLALKYAKRKKK